MSVVIPHWNDLPDEVRRRLIGLASSHGIDINSTHPKTRPDVSPEHPGMYLLNRDMAENLVFEIYTFLYHDMERCRLQREHRENAGLTRGS